jgi:hypothetical protein
LPSGIKWADRNLGASSITDAGAFYAWGETTEKDIYTWDNYLYGTNEYISKYNVVDSYGFVDNIGALVDSDNPTKRYGSNYDMPTDNDITELLENTTRIVVHDFQGSGVSGVLFTSKINQQELFIPLAGYKRDGNLIQINTFACVWAKSLYPYKPIDAYTLCLTDKGAGLDYYFRYFGYNIRPVVR